MKLISSSSSVNIVTPHGEAEEHSPNPSSTATTEAARPHTSVAEAVAIAQQELKAETLPKAD